MNIRTIWIYYCLYVPLCYQKRFVNSKPNEPGGSKKPSSSTIVSGTDSVIIAQSGQSEGPMTSISSANEQGRTVSSQSRQSGSSTSFPAGTPSTSQQTRQPGQSTPTQRTQNLSASRPKEPSQGSTPTQHQIPQTQRTPSSQETHPEKKGIVSQPSGSQTISSPSQIVLPETALQPSSVPQPGTSQGIQHDSHSTSHLSDPSASTSQQNKTTPSQQTIKQGMSVSQPQPATSAATPSTNPNQFVTSQSSSQPIPSTVSTAPNPKVDDTNTSSQDSQKISEKSVPSKPSETSQQTNESETESYEPVKITLRSGFLIRRIGVSYFTDPSLQFTEDYVTSEIKSFDYNINIFTKTYLETHRNDMTQYTKKIGIDGYIYEFRTNSNVFEIHHKNKKIWEMDDSGDYPEYMEFSLTQPPHIIIRCFKRIFIYRYVDGVWKLSSYVTDKYSIFNIPKISITTSSGSYGKYTFENDELKYILITDDSHDLFYYEFLMDPHSLCLKYDGIEIFSHTVQEFGQNYPTRVYFHKRAPKVAIQFKGFHLIYNYDGKKWVYDSKVINTFDEYSLQVLTVDPNVFRKTNVNDETQYHFTKHYHLFHYAFNPGSKCVGLKYKGYEVWSRHQLFEDHYPKSISFDVETGYFHVYFGEQWYYVYKFLEPSDAWYLDFKNEALKPDSLPAVEAIIPKPKKRTIVEFAEEGSSTVIAFDDKGQKVDPMDLAKLRRGAVTKELETETETLESWAHERVIPTDFTPYRGSFKVVYQYNHERKVSGLYFCKMGIWVHHPSDPNPQLVSFLPDIFMASVKFTKTNFFIYKYNGTDWSRIRTSIEETIELDIDVHKAGRHYLHSKKGNLETYITEDDKKYLFDTVKLGGTGSSHRGTRTKPIWKTEQPFEYGLMVEVYRHGNLANKIDVTIHFLNGCELTLSSEGLYKPFKKNKWSETVSVMNDSMGIEVFTSDDVDKKNQRKNDISRFDLFKYVKKDNGISKTYKYVFKFYKNSYCFKIIHNKEKIWERDASLKDNFPKKITFDLERKNYSFEFIDANYNFEHFTKDWETSILVNSNV